MNIWYEIIPVDTLFFRGAEAMEAGQLSCEALFPPPVSVLEGALRTAYLRQQKVPFAEYNAGNCSDSIVNQIGKSGEKAPFSVVAILFRKTGVDYIPCPANWFVAEAGKGSCSQKETKSFAGLKIHLAELKSFASEKLKFTTSVSGSKLPIAVAKKDLTPLAGYWMKRDLLTKRPDTLAKDDILAGRALYDMEPRTGIALDEKRRVIQGKLYSTGHLRLRPNVSIIIAIDRHIGLAATGIVSLGGEKRMCGYTAIAVAELPSLAAFTYMALAPVELTESLLPLITCASRPLVLAGWDLHTGFHKPTTSWLPAGSVFSSNINNLCVPLPN